MRALGNSVSRRPHCPGLRSAFFVNRPNDVWGCPAAPEGFSFTAFLALLLSSRFSTCVFVWCVSVVLCVVCVCVSVVL